MPNPSGSNGSGSRWSPVAPSSRQVLPYTGPNWSDCPGVLGCLDMLMRRGVYIALQPGGDSAVVGITILDGRLKRRCWCHSAKQLSNAISDLWLVYDLDSPGGWEQDLEAEWYQAR